MKAVACIFVLVAGACVPLLSCHSAEPPRTGDAPVASRIQLSVNEDNALCSAYAKALEKASPASRPTICKLQKQVAGPGFSMPAWEELDVMQHLPLIYQAVMQLPPLDQQDQVHPSFDEWKSEFLRKVEGREISPRLQRVEVSLNDRGVETLILYVPNSMSCERYNLIAGGNIFVVRPGEKLEQIDGIAGSGLPMEILEHEGRAVFFATHGRKNSRGTVTVHEAYSFLSGAQHYVLEKQCELRFQPESE